MPILKTTRGEVWFADQRRDTRRPEAILIHGAGGSHLSFPAELRRHPAFNASALDLPGHGKSAGGGHKRIADYAADVAAWLDALEIDSAILIGHSMGGAIAQWLALEYAPRVAGLVLLNTGARLPVNPALLAGLQADREATIDRLLRWMWSKAAPAEMIQQSAQIMRATDPAVLQRDFSACADFDVRPRLGEITAPTLIIAGAADKMTPLALSEELAQGIAQSTLTVIAGGSHMLLLEEPASVASAIQDWLGESRGWRKS